MRRLLLCLVLLVAAVAVGYAILNRTDSAAGTAPSIAGALPTAGTLLRGEYLAKAADCIACHTVAGSDANFAGGVAFRLPFGTIYSSNITSDPDTGIGRWSDDDFVRAVREGVRKDGEHLYPAFPYTSYTQLSRVDALAIKAYLFSLPAIKQATPVNDLHFPFNQRWGMGFWNAAFFKSGRFVSDSSKSAQWNSGAYLASGLGHCAECHTPRNLGFGLEHGKELAGEELQGWRAYNITADSKYGIGAWSDVQLAAFLKSGHAQGHASAAGPMGEAVSNSLQYLNDEDIASLVTYLRSVPAREGTLPIEINDQPAPAMASTEALPGTNEQQAHAQGLKLFEGACASCHQWNGQGEETPYAALLGTRGVNDVTGANITQAILQGVNMHVAGNNVYMPAFAAAYSDAEISALANYIIGHFGGKEGTVTPDEVAKRRNL